MTTLSKQTLTALFQTGDVPSGTDFANLIDSQINVAETSVQSMIGAINPTELITARVSAADVNVTGNLTVAGTFSAAAFSTTSVTTSALTVTGAVSAGSLNVSTDISAAGTIAASASRMGLRLSTPIIISAAGTALATATLLTGGTNRVQGVADGQTTGVRLTSQVGLQQYVINESSISANLWPFGSDYKINALTSGAAFAMAANTLYTIVQTTNSAAYVK